MSDFYNPDVPAGYQDADIEMREWKEAGNRAARTKYVIEFREPSNDLTLYACFVKGALGYTSTKREAEMWTRDVAERTLENGYGPSMREIAALVEA